MSSPAADALRAALRALESGDDREVLRTAQRAQDALDAVKADRLCQLEETRAHELDGTSTVSVWARDNLRLPAHETKAMVAAARTSASLPRVGEAFQRGEVRVEHMTVFTYGLRHVGAAVMGASTDWLLDVARACEPLELRRVVRALREAVYPEALDEAWVRGMDKQDVRVDAVPDGWHVTGFLPTVTGAKLRTVLDSLGAPRDVDDNRTGAERRVDALDEVLTSVLADGLPSDKGIRPQISVLVDADTYEAAHAGTAPGAPAELAGFGAIGPRLLGYLTCSSDVTPLLTTTRGGSLPQADVLNVGRTSRLANRAQRRAVHARQRGACAAPGCTSTHLEIHHATWWSRGGRTDLDELVGLCPRCHHLVHRDLLVVTAHGGGRFTFTDKDLRPLRQAARQRLRAWQETRRIREVAHHLQRSRDRREPLLA